MRTGNWLALRSRSLVLGLTGAAALGLIVACGGGGSDPEVAPEPTATPAATAVAAPTAVPTPAPGPDPVTTDPEPGIVATAAPAAEQTPEPAATPEPTPTPQPTATPTPIVSNIFDGYGFQLKLDEDTTFASADFAVRGWTGDSATESQGLLTFNYNGADVVLFWEPESGTPKALADTTYELQKLSKPGFEFTAINEGDLTVDGQTGRYGGFVYSDTNGDNASGGLIGAWSCPDSDTALSLTATSEDSTALQIRFDRLVSGFACGV